MSQRTFLILAGVLTGLILTVTYVLLRFAPSPLQLTLLSVSILLVFLAVIGWMAADAEHGAPFLAVALVLPYLLLGVGVLAAGQRVSSELDGVFGDAGGSSENYDPSDDVDPSFEGILDDNADGVDDTSYVDVDCSTLTGGREFNDDCRANGGY